VLEELVDDDSWFAFIASIDKEDDWTSVEAWKKANPNYGISLKADDFNEKVKRAKAIPSEQNAFKRLKLNIWTEQFERWLDVDKWDECAAPLTPLLGRRCYAGLDLASTIDIAALVLVFPDDSEPSIYDVLPFFWIPKGTLIERARKSDVPFLAWTDQELMTATEGNVIHYQAIEDKIDELAQLYDIEEVAFDRWGATQMVQKLEDAGLDVVPIGQGFASMSPPTKELQNLTLSKRIRHGGNPVLRWMAGNLVVRQDAAENIKPDKSKSTEKIDGMVALIMAIDRATRYENVYDDRGILVF
jgi:phage terminase large subunit-like protein